VTELVLTRTPDDRRLYSLEGVGTLRFEGLFSRSATAQAGARSWSLGHRGFWQRAMQATDAAGSVVGEFVPREIRRGGALAWGGRELTLRPASLWRERYALAEKERELALIDGKSWGRQPVNVTLEGSGELEPGLLLFAAFVVRQLAVNAADSAGAGSTAAVG
jgi:hypothetical protein